jgi:multidrug efflux pump subunit AcrA (membrane-fusion protein)
MQLKIRWLSLIVLVVGLLLSACSVQAQNAAPELQPAVVEPIEGTEFNRVVLSEKAAQRLDVQTTPVRNEQVNGTERMVIPYGALIYDLQGATWVYVSPQPLTFERKAVTVDFIDGDIVVLTDGPAVGTEVAMVGVPELYGIDTGVGK